MTNWPGVQGQMKGIFGNSNVKNGKKYGFKWESIKGIKNRIVSAFTVDS